MRFKKIRKIYRILFPLQLTEKEKFVNRLVSNSMVEIVEQEVENCYKVKLKNKLELYVRDENHSDYSVFQQIFNFEEYKTVLSLLKLSVFKRILSAFSTISNPMSKSYLF